MNRQEQEDNKQERKNMFFFLTLSQGRGQGGDRYWTGSISVGKFSAVCSFVGLQDTATSQVDDHFLHLALR